MRTNLYGISRIWCAKEVKSPFFPMEGLKDMDSIWVDADWEEICTIDQASIKYTFELNSNVYACKVELNAILCDDIPTDIHPLFYKVKDNSGNLLIVGLGNDYPTVPATTVTDAINSSPDEGVKKELSVSWNCMCGRVFLKI